MNIIVMSELMAIRTATELDKDTDIISITCTGDKDVEFVDNPHIKMVFRMKFNDVTQATDGLDAPKKDDFIGLKDFVDSIKSNVLIVHCGAGVSRSAATAAAISEYLDIEHFFFTNHNYSPNPLVYRLAQEELGIYKDQDYYNSVFSNMEIDEEIRF